MENTLQWIERSRLGDRDAFARIVEQYQGMVSAVTFNLVGDFAAAEKGYTEAIRREPTSYYYWQRANFFEYTKKDLQKALADYTTAIQCAEKEKADSPFHHSEFPIEAIYQNRGKLYEKLGEPDKAAADIKKAK